MVILNKEEVDALARGLDLLARQHSDVIVAAMQLAPLRKKLEDSIREPASQKAVLQQSNPSL